jgi:hypothetical protein
MDNTTKATIRGTLTRMDLAQRVMREAMKTGDVVAMRDAVNEMNGCAAIIDELVEIEEQA